MTDDYGFVAVVLAFLAAFSVAAVAILQERSLGAVLACAVAAIAIEGVTQ